MSEQFGDAGETAASSDEGAGATAYPSSQGTVVVPATPPRSDERQSSEDESRTAGETADRETDEREEALSVDDLQARLRASRRAEKAKDRELERYRSAEKAREDANKSELERAQERAEAAEARAAMLERANQARDIAAEFGIPSWADELANDPDARAMKAHAQRIRERLNPGAPGMDGGVRGLGVAPQPSSMDDLIRGRAGR